MRQIISNYELVASIPAGEHAFIGNSSSEKSVIFRVFKDVSLPVRVLDIGFGCGSLGELIKNNPDTSHWQVDGIDGYDISCRNIDLFNKRYYRNIWHTPAQDVPIERMREYDVLCLLDVIEHLHVEEAKRLLKKLLLSLREDSFLFISTPLWFYPQNNQEAGDLEEHLIGVPASSMMALLPLMYAISSDFVGNFVYGRQSIDYIDLFQPVTDKAFSLERGVNVAVAVGMQLTPGILNTMPPPVKLKG
ncbi:MAG: methyltransferase domain-containing protein [Magnetococcales bacterium]|nr:methyltransferase domain-containing protein [Magnetococcales bacterium]